MIPDSAADRTRVDMLAECIWRDGERCRISINAFAASLRGLRSFDH